MCNKPSWTDASSFAGRGARAPGDAARPCAAQFARLRVLPQPRRSVVPIRTDRSRTVSPRQQLSNPSRTRQDGRVGVAPVKVGPSACASRTANAAPLTAAPSDAFSQRGPGWTWRGRTPTRALQRPEPETYTPRTQRWGPSRPKSSLAVPPSNSGMFPRERAAIDRPRNPRRRGAEGQDIQTSLVVP